MQQLPLGVRIRDRAVFGTYLPARNTQAVDHLALVAGGHRLETSWICGPHGTGKTHLLQAVCVQASESVQAAYYPMRELASTLGIPLHTAYSRIRALRRSLELYLLQYEVDHG